MILFFQPSHQRVADLAAELDQLLELLAGQAEVVQITIRDRPVPPVILLQLFLVKVIMVAQV
jgi:hypothetical protein